MEQLGTLRLDAPSQPGRPAHLAAASGLVRRGERLYVVADDEPALGIFDLRGRGRMERLADDELPLDHAERKAAKPDLEALAEMPGGGLLALGSGATDRRERGWLWSERHVREVVLGTLYARLRERFAELNIEGAAAVGERLWLAQRGNGAAGENALVAVGLDLVSVGETVTYELGEVDGVPLTFTDLAPLPGGPLAFCAVAEDSGSTYDDGPVAGAGIGVLDPDAQRVLAFDLVPDPVKVEGVTASADGALLAVGDADDVSRPAPLLRVSMPA